MRWKVAEVARAMGVAVPEGLDPLARLAGVSIDSRTVGTGELFFAIRGPRHDGHDFVAAALARGAMAAVAEDRRAADYSPAIRSRLLLVDDTLRSFEKLAQNYRQWWKDSGNHRRLAAVTGSAGKTTTKEILAALLAARSSVLKSEGNLNNEYGLPLTLFRLEEGHEAAVVELGMSHGGELARLAEIARPDVGVVTNVAPVHLEFFNSLEEIASAKRELIEGLAGEAPLAVLNADVERVSRFADGFRGRVLTFGLSRRAGFRAAHIAGNGMAGSAFDFEGPSESGRLTLPLAGSHNVLNALAARAAASDWGVGIPEARRVFPLLRPGAMRGEFLRFAAGFALINDCYNSNPVALKGMIDLLGATRGYERRILLAGEMRELGPTSAGLHEDVGRYAASQAGLDWILGVAGEAEHIVRGAREQGHAADQSRFFASPEEAASFLAGFVRPGDLLLVKGSRGVHMETIAETLERRFPLAEAATEGDRIEAREGRG